MKEVKLEGIVEDKEYLVYAKDWGWDDPPPTNSIYMSSPGWRVGEFTTDYKDRLVFYADSNNPYQDVTSPEFIAKIYELPS